MVKDSTKNAPSFPAEELDALASEFPGRVGFYVKDLSSGAGYALHEDERFPTASVFKLPVTVELFRQADRGEIDLDERRRMAPDISSHGSGQLKLLRDQPELTLRDYCRLMIAISDNMSTDMLVRAVGTDAVNRMLDEQGLVNTRVPMEIGRWAYVMVGMDDAPISRENDEAILTKMRAMEYVEDGLAFSDSLENLVASPHDMGVLLERLDRGELAGAEATTEMLDMLTAAWRQYLRVGLRADIKVASKIGSSHRMRNDAAIVYLPTGAMIVVGFTLADPGQPKSTELLTEKGGWAVGAVAPEAVRPAETEC